ncbi:LamG domain-containing protein [Rhizomonospora bruguierae]|uniref:LamG domain-containing protein n=1 Tax=Rhizomonospora bruguierae TaxID=1581705 RepID=UPI001BCC6A1B|nr:LamG domain-containing protein [Micromonospora sp. NBRC 107566]
MEQSLVKAQQTSAPVPVPAATTAIDTVVANPSGTVTVTRSAIPQRAKVDGAWKDLDPTLHINADGSLSPAVSAGGTVTAHITNLDAPDPITAQPAQALLTATHSWPLNGTYDNQNAMLPAYDVIGGLHGTPSAGASWNNGDLFDPDLYLDGTNGVVSTASAALATDNDFSVSAWVKPLSTGGTVLSQDGTKAPGFKLWTEASDSSWRFGMSTSDTAAPTFDTADAGAGSARIGSWNLLVATYRKSTGAMTLHVNGVKAAIATHTTTWNATGSFRIGDHRNNTAHAGNFTGQVAHVDTHAHVLDPTQDASPAGYYQAITQTRILDTRNGTGAPTAPLNGGSTLALQVTGQANIPAEATAVAINLAVANPTTSSFLVTYPDGTTRPTNTSAMQYPAGQTTSSMVIVPLGTNGKIAIYEHGTGKTDLLADVAGYFTTGTNGQKYHAINPTRLLDTRRDGTPVAANGLKKVAQGNTVIALDPSLVLNITVTQGTANGYITAYPDGTTRPTASTLNYNANETVPNLAITPTGNGTVDLYNSSTGTTHLVIDCLGYFAAT